MKDDELSIKMMNAITKLTILLLGTACVTVCAAETSGSKPNILLILADDMGYGDLKAYNPQSKIATTHLDQLAASGLVFTDAHAGGSTCVPSRFALISGQYAARMGRRGNGPLIAKGQATIASLLRDNGYRTAMVGKWHLGFEQIATKDGARTKGIAFDYSRPLTGGPVDCGFDSFFGMHASLDIPPYFYIRDRAPLMEPTDTVAARDSVGGPEDWNRIQGAFWREGPVAPDFKHAEVTPRFGDEACKVIESHDGGKPLFLYLALPSPHTPWLPAKEFTGKSGAGMYGDYVMTVDSVVGRVLGALDKAGMTQDTLVLFSSDNGPVWYEKDVTRFKHRAVGPLRGAKGSVWEGGHRMPFIARWPARVKAGGRTDHLVSFADVFATFVELVGEKANAKGTAGDSESFLAGLLHPGERHPERSPVLHGEKCIREGDWKLIVTRGSRGFTADPKMQYGMELYNLRDDLAEANNLFEKMPEKVESLRAKIGQILGKTTDKED